MFQAGISAAGCTCAENNVQRLQEIRQPAAWMAEQLRALSARRSRNDPTLVRRVGEEQAPALGKLCRQGVLINAFACCPVWSPETSSSAAVSEWSPTVFTTLRVRRVAISSGVGASGYIGQHFGARIKRARLSGAAAARHIDRLQKLALPSIPARSVF